MSDDSREIELKFRLESSAQAAALLTAVVGGAWSRAPVRQVNHFFDTAGGDLNRARYTLRLRVQEGENLLTAKGPERKSPDGTLSDKAEDERPVGPAEAGRLLRGEHSPLDALATALGAPSALLSEMRALIAGQPLLHVGAFENERTSVPAALEVEGRHVPLLFELDCTLLPGGRVDHEVEVELGAEGSPQVAEAVRALLRRAGIEPRAAPSKAQRFFETIRKP
jgi:uncharacterized protein YjbK